MKVARQLARLEEGSAGLPRMVAQLFYSEDRAAQGARVEFEVATAIGKGEEHGAHIVQIAAHGFKIACGGVKCRQRAAFDLLLHHFGSLRLAFYSRLRSRRVSGG